jgi:hypothetical protein
MIEEGDWSNFRPQPYIFRNLTVEAVAGQVILRGTAYASLDASIGGVGTVLTACSADIAPSACQESYFIHYTSPACFSFTVLGTPIPVEAGQAIEVKVTIMFQADPGPV